MYIFISGTLIAAPHPCSHFVGILDSWSGFVKIWKHSAKLFLLVINRLNKIVSFCYFVCCCSFFGE